MAAPPTGVLFATVLVVDDEEAVRSLTARMLREAGYRVLAAADGAEALLLALKAETPIDLVVSDLRMPRMDGEALARELVAHDPACRFIFISGHPGARALPGPLVAKPFGPADLLAAVDAALDRPAAAISAS